MTLGEQALLILGMAAVTYIPRVAPLLMLASRSPHPNLLRFLEMIPPAVLAALLAPELLLHTVSGEPRLFFSGENIFLLAAVPTVCVGILRGTFFGTVATGMLSVALLRAGQGPLPLFHPEHALILAAVPALVTGLWRRSFFLAVGAGVFAYGLLRLALE